jgi:hypothetical protein
MVLALKRIDLFHAQFPRAHAPKRRPTKAAHSCFRVLGTQGHGIVQTANANSLATRNLTPT